jgi:hypothetical protein
MARPKKEPKGIPQDPADYQGQPALPEQSGVVSVVGPDGRTRYAWCKDGVRPVIDLDDFARNIHSALDGTPGADFADHRGPQ